MFYVYALQSLKKKDWLYIGFSDDLKNRVLTHQRGKVVSKSRYRPLRLVYYEAYLNREDATKREYQIKNNSQQKEQLKKNTQQSLNTPQ